MEENEKDFVFKERELTPKRCLRCEVLFLTVPEVRICSQCKNSAAFKTDADGVRGIGENSSLL